MCRKSIYVAAVAFAVLTAPQCVWAVDGIWSSTATPSNWSATSNWVNGTVPDGSSANADFSQVDVPSGGINVNIDIEPLATVGNLIFGDTSTSSPGGWLISKGDPGGTLKLVVNSGVPNITVNSLGGTAVVQFNTALDAEQGLNKLGSGTLVLNSSDTTIVGNVTVNAGTLKLAACDNMLEPASTLTVNGTLDLGGYNQTIYGYYSTGTSPVVNSGGIVINGTVQNGTLIDASSNPSGGLLDFDARSGLVTANLSENLLTYGSAGLTKSTSGTLTLSGNNTYTAGTIVNDGTLIFNTLSSIPATGSMTVNGGLLQFNSSSLPLPSGSITVNTGGTLAVTGPYATTNAWLNSGKIVNTSAGTLALVQDESSITMSTGAGYASLSLGAVGTLRFTGTLTPMNNAYRLGGYGDLIISKTNSLTNNGATPRSVEIVGGTVELPYSNSYTGGTTLTGGVLKIGNNSSIGGATTSLTFNGGELEINNSGLNIDSNNVNWSTFSGGFTIDPGVTFTINHSISGPGSFGKDGGGTMVIGGTFNMDQGIALNYGTTVISPGASLTAGLSFNVINGGGVGHVIIGQSGSSLPTTMTVTGGDAANYTGYMKLGGGFSGTRCTVDIYGNNTILQTTPGTGQNAIFVSEWGNSLTTVNIHDGATFSTGFLAMADWGYTGATVNVYDHANLNANMLAMGMSGNGGAVVNLYNNSHVNASGYYSWTDGSNVVATYGAVIINLGGYMPYSTLNIGDNAVINAGELDLCRDVWWNGSAAYANVTGNSRINLTTDNNGLGDVNVGYGGNGIGFLNISGTAQVSAAHNIYVGFSSNSGGYISVKGSGILSGAELDLSTPSTYAAHGNREIDISEIGQILISGDVNQGQSSGTGGSAGLMNVTGNGYLRVGGNYNLTNGTLTVSDATGTPQVNVLGNMTAGVTGGSACTVAISGNGTLKIGNTTTGTGNLILVNGTLNTSAVSDTGGADGRVQLMGATSAIVFNGGTISPTASNVNFMPASIPAAYTGTRGAIFDTAGFNITVAKGIADSPSLGVGGLTKQGSGTLTLTGANTYSGGTTVAAGALEFNTAASIPAAGAINVNGGVLRFTSPAAIPPAGSINVNAGGALEVNASDPYTNVTNWLGSGKIVSGSSGVNGTTGFANPSGAIALSADSAEAINMGAYDNLSLGSTGSWSYAGALTPSGTYYRLGGGGGSLYIPIANTITGGGKILVVNGPGLVVLQNNNDYSGGTVLDGGTLSYANDASIGGAASAITFNGGILMVPAGTPNDLGSHVVNWNSFNGGFDVPDGATLTITQVMAGTGSLTKSGSGTLTLTGSSTYSGATNIYYGTISYGTLVTSGENDLLPTGSNITVTTGATLNLGGNTQSTTAIVTIAGGTIQNGTLTSSSSPFNAQSGTVSAVLAGSVGLTKSTTGTLVLSNVNTYLGGTTINAGTLQLSGAGRLPNTPTTVNTGGTLDLGGVNQPVNGTTFTLAGGTVQNGTLTKNLLSYALQSGNVSAVLGGLLAGVTKTTTGTVTLSAVNTYRGITSVHGGTLLLSGGNNRIASSSMIQVTNNFADNTSPVSRGTLDLGGNSQTCTSSNATGAVQIIDGTLQDGTMINNGTRYYVQSGTVSAVLAGTAGLYKTIDPLNTNNGTATLSNINTYTGGTTVSGGSLLLTGGNNPLYTGGAITVTDGFLDFGGYSQTTSGAVSIQGGEIDNGAIVKSGAAYDLQAGTVTANLQGTAGLTKSTTNLATLTGANMYSGGTTVSAGTLQLNGGNNRLATNGAITITGGLLDFGLNSQTTSAAVSFQGGIVQNGTIIKSGAPYDAQAGLIAVALQGTAGLTKTTTGVVSVTGALTYTGTTDIEAGTLQINNGLSTVLAAVTGTSAGTLGIGNTSTVTATSVSVGTITLGAGSTLVISALPGGPSAGGALTPVPEPGTLLMLAIAALTLMGVAWRGKNNKS